MAKSSRSIIDAFLGLSDSLALEKLLIIGKRTIITINANAEVLDLNSDQCEHL